MNRKSAALLLLLFLLATFFWVWAYTSSISHGERLMKILPTAANLEILHAIGASARLTSKPFCNEIRYHEIDRQDICASPMKVREFTDAAECKPATVFLTYRLFPLTNLQATIITQGDASGLEQAFLYPPDYIAHRSDNALPRSPFDKLPRSDARYLRLSEPRHVGFEDCGNFQVYRFNF